MNVYENIYLCLIQPFQFQFNNKQSKKQKQHHHFTSNSDYFCAKRFQKIKTTSTTAQLPTKSCFTKMKEKNKKRENLLLINLMLCDTHFLLPSFYFVCSYIYTF